MIQKSMGFSKNSSKREVYNSTILPWGFSGGSGGKESTCNMGEPGSISGLGRHPGKGNGTPLQYSCLQNLMDRGASWATVHGVAQSRTQLERHSNSSSSRN